MDKRIQKFSEGISPKVNAAPWLDFELVYI